jgi:hypothetical protein
MTLNTLENIGVRFLSGTNNNLYTLLPEFWEDEEK